MRGGAASRLICAGLLLAGLSLGCRLDTDEAPEDDLAYRVALPPGFPDLPVPPDNALTRPRVALGRKLFYDPILSRDSSIACASCHAQDLAFTDGLQFSEGIEGRRGFRNAPSLGNLAWHPYFFYDGGVPTLELQILAPIEAHFEMDAELLDVVERLRRHPQYPSLFRLAYGRDPDPYGLTRALAAFERTLLTGDAPYDRHLAGDTGAMGPAALRGLALFQRDSLGCAACHPGFDLTDHSFQNIGLPETPGDSGRMRITLDEGDRGKFKTPSLRNVALTAPYMHDGSIQTLEEVIDHFASGGVGHVNQSPRVAGFQVTAAEKADLVAFLHALTDEGFVRNPDHGR